MEEKRKLGTGLQVWLWIIFVLNIITALGALAAVVGSAALGVGPVYTVLCVVSFLLEIVLIVGIAMLLFKSKKVGFYMICGAAVIGFVVNLITYGLVSGLTAINIGRAVVGLVVCPLVTYLLAKNDWAKSETKKAGVRKTPAFFVY